MRLVPCSRYTGSVLQDDSEEDEEDNGTDDDRTVSTIACVVDGDANLMSADADRYTTLHSDEDELVEEEPEDEENCDEDDWMEDWSIGELTDEESGVEGEALPESVCVSVARNKKAVSTMRTNGWEYG
ncbi:hypothetical protein PC120_g8944 [Phytophthora cactorum]|nr:hypothetical protein PC120_g8944 [Phytophthora cactorum]